MISVCSNLVPGMMFVDIGFSVTLTGDNLDDQTKTLKGFSHKTLSNLHQTRGKCKNSPENHNIRCTDD